MLLYDNFALAYRAFEPLIQFDNSPEIKIDESFVPKTSKYSYSLNSMPDKLPICNFTIEPKCLSINVT